MKEYYTIREIADLFQIAESTLRYWESQGLISPRHNPYNGYREYSMQSIVEISDIILYRSLNLPIKEVQRLSGMTYPEMEVAIARAEDRVLNQIESLEQVKVRILKRKEKLEEYQRLAPSSYTFAELPVMKVLPYVASDRVSMQMYLDQSCDYVLLSHADDPENITDGVSVAADHPSEAPLWRNPEDGARYVEFLISIRDYTSIQADLRDRIAAVRALGHRPGLLICKYLFSCCSDKRGASIDYYHAWVQVS